MRKSVKILLFILGIFFSNFFLNKIQINNFLTDSCISLEIYTSYEIKTSQFYNLTGSPIIINGNGGWYTVNLTVEWCTGSGTFNDPYIIQNVLIDGQNSGNCIEIKNSDVYFIIKNCSVYNSGNGSSSAGIFLDNVKNGNLVDSIHSYDNDYGIHLIYCYNITIEGNVIENNHNFGIILGVSNDNLISNNILYNNGYEGIFLGISNHSRIIGNTVTNNGNFGIYIGSSSKNNTISENTVRNNNGGGITASTSNNSTIRRNNVIHNKIGIEVWQSNYNKIYENNISENYDIWGIWVAGGSEYNLFYNNCFINNEVNAWDDGMNNNWNCSILGNYWDDYNGNDADNNGIGDIPYVIDGSANSVDQLPLMQCSLLEDGVIEDGVIEISGYNIILLTSIFALISIALFKKSKKNSNNPKKQ